VHTARRLVNGDVIEDVTWLYDGTIVTSRSSKSSHSEIPGSTRSTVSVQCGPFKHTVH